MVLVDKPAGPTSHDVVAAVRRHLGVRRVGHTGTLDPFATGLLVLLFGKATRLSRFLTTLDKTYTGVIRLGAGSDTDDSTGTITETSECGREVSDAAIDDAMRTFRGGYRQRPPAYSAKKIAGERAHRLARRGQPVTLTARDVRIHRFERTGRAGADVSFAATVGSGTYIRALARDLGERLECAAHVRTLRRTRVGTLRVEDASAVDALSPEAVRPLTEAVAHLPRLDVDASARLRLEHGQPLPYEWGDGSGAVAVMAGDDLIAVAERDGDLLKPRVVLTG